MLKNTLIYRNISSSAIKPMKRKPLKALLTVSSEATSRIISMFSVLDKPTPLGIRISINKKGCNGLHP
jgi:hypothetical protein